MLFKKVVFLFFALMISVNSFANNIQIFGGLNYTNPAELTRVQNALIVLGDVHVNPRVKFIGTDLSGTGTAITGTAISDQSAELPYGQIAKRINDQFVIGLVYSHPFISLIKYPDDAIIRFSALETRLHGFDISPRISMKVSDQISLGVGFNAQRITSGALNSAVPGGLIRVEPEGGILYNRFSDWGYGYNLGLYYIINPKTFCGLSYYSAVRHQNASGTSTLGSLQSTNLLINVPVPAVLTLDLQRVITRQLFGQLVLRYSFLNVAKDLYLRNTAIGDRVIPQYNQNSFETELNARYQLYPKLAIFAGGRFDQNPIKTTYRSTGLPSYHVWGVGAGLDLNVAKNTNILLAYAHAFSRPIIQTVPSVGTAVGRIRLNINVIQLQASYSY